MANNEEQRWLQRFENLEKAYAQLAAACAVKSYSNLELAGLVQTFQFTFELSWKTLKDLLFYEGYAVDSPREVLRQSFSMGIVPDVDRWLQALESRNRLTRTYNPKTASEAQKLIKTVYWPMLTQLMETLRKRKLES